MLALRGAAQPKGGATPVAVSMIGGRRLGNIGGARFRQKPFHLAVVSLKRIAHDEAIAAVARDRVPVDHVREIAVLEKSYSPRAARRACICRRNMRRTRPPDVVVPLGDALTGRDTEEQSPPGINVVIFQI